MTWAAFERMAYQAARSWGMQPSEFWQLPVADWWAELDAHIVESRMVKEQVERAKGGGKGRSAFTGAEWQEARRKRVERLKAKNDRT